MHKLVQGMLIAAGIALAGLSAASAAPAGGGDMLGTSAASGLVQNAEWGYCDRLRRACFRRGERSECYKYREDCWQDSYCEQLRRACVYKQERGEYGHGNCRRYREDCRRR
jgi:hypothetical protein